GGIPPLFHAIGREEYFLIVNEKWQPINEEVLAIIGDQLSMSGKEIVWNDWRILKVNTSDLAAMASTKKLQEQLTAFESGMTICAIGTSSPE
ncbi:MAG TPA: hypothetical protein VF141_22475, partial [Chryseolinea sp.]